MVLQDGFPTPKAAALSGVSRKTLENWDQRGFLKPSIKSAQGHGHARVYSFRDLIAIRVADDLRTRGIDVRHLRRVVDYLRKRKGLDLTASDVLANAVLVTDGHDVYEVDGEHGVHTSTLRHPDQSVLLVPLGRLVAKIQAEALKGLASTSRGKEPRRVRTA
jgi:DNA-binding transcriptional MerR regulator